MTTTRQLTMGIDTGGTFTDGVLFDPQTRTVLRALKVLTTHSDLTLCIFEIMEQLLKMMESLGQAELSVVSLSTTLATNAIAEGKRKPTALFLLGYDPEIIRKFHFEQEFGTPYYFYIDGKHDLNGREICALDEVGLVAKVKSIQDTVEAFAVVSYSGSRNSTHEELAASLISALSDKPIVQGHHLSQELDSIRRATTASLNASLLSNTQKFLQAVENMLHQYGVDCPVMIVRGDGSVARSDYIRKRPVEIIHSGPATSAIGGQFLAGVHNGLVIDIGGTTTDIALVENGVVVNGETAATVGPYRTCVRTIKARSFGLGGDSHIYFDRHQRFSIGPKRVLPISRLCSEFPAFRETVAQWINEKNQTHHFGRFECWVLRKLPQKSLKNPRAMRAVELLQQGPWLLPDLLKAVGVVSPVQLRMDELVNLEIIERAGLTPTDLLHVQGQFMPWDGEIVQRFVDKSAQTLGMPTVKFIDTIWRTIHEIITVEIMQFLTGKALSENGYVNRADDLDRWLFNESIHPQNQHLCSRISLQEPIVGIGAPAQAFLEGAAKMLGTTAIFPPHFEVANAVGTVVGNVITRLEGEVVPNLVGSMVSGYTARAGSLQHTFAELPSARAFVREHLINAVAAEAREAGAEHALVECEEREVLSGMILTFSAWAVGKALK